MRFRKTLPIIVIVFLALFLRVAKISFVPPALNWDEVSHAYNAYSILKTGRDEWGKLFPIIFRAYGDYKLPVYIYLTTISEFFLGLEVLAVRLPSILAGVGTVVFSYLLVKKLFGDEKLGLITAALVAIEPWDLFLSRVAVEANVALFLVIAGVYFLQMGKYTPGVYLLGLSVWTYNSARIFTPLIFLSFFFLYKPKFKVRHWVVAALLFLPMFYQLVNPIGLARYEKVKILSEGVIAQINHNRVTSELPGMLPTLVHNKIVYFASILWSNYFTHFNPDFLFFKGGSHYQFSVPGHGLLYVLSLPFLIIGVLSFLRKRKEKETLFLFFWLIFSPLPSSLTNEAPHALRSLVMFPVLVIVIASGILATYSFLKRKLGAFSFPFVILVAVLYFLSLEKYALALVGEYRQKYSWSWQYGYEQIVNYAKQNYSKYDKIIVTKKYGEPHEFFLFYLSWDPEGYRSDPNLIRFDQSEWFWVDRFDKFYFANDWEIKDLVLESGGKIDCGSSSCLVITSEGNSREEWEKIDEVKFLDGERAFEIYEI